MVDSLDRSQIRMSGLSSETTTWLVWLVGGVFSELPDHTERAPYWEYPQVKRGSTHSRSGVIWSQFKPNWPGARLGQLLAREADQQLS